MEESATQRRLRGMFEYLKGLHIKGFNFASYDEYKAAKLGQTNLAGSDVKKTDLKGEMGFIAQRALSERDEEFANLDEAGLMRYREMFGENPD
jgi:hypothetical protein